MSINHFVSPHGAGLLARSFTPPGRERSRLEQWFLRDHSQIGCDIYIYITDYKKSHSYSVLSTHPQRRAFKSPISYIPTKRRITAMIDVSPWLKRWSSRIVLSLRSCVGCGTFDFLSFEGTVLSMTKVSEAATIRAADS